MTVPDYDVAMVSDFRYKGGTSASVAQEVRAQHAAGYRTALVPMRSPQLLRRRSFHPAIVECVQAGMADLLAPDAEARARLALIRHPVVLSEPPDPAPRLEPGQALVVANQTVRDLGRPDEPYYDVAAVDRQAEALLGLRPRWAPIGPQVRHSLLESGASVELTPEDWHNVIDVAEWSARAGRPGGAPPVIGRHSRPGWKKWPGDAAAIRAAYPTDGSLRVELLGGGETAVKLLGERPAAWTVHPFRSLPPSEFLRRIDVFVYFHHPDVDEAFGRAIIEALASGTPAVVSEDFRPLFEDACLYARPEEVPEIVRALCDDPAAYAARADHGRRFVEERFGLGVHRRRLAELVGAPSGVAARPPRPGRRALFVTANGVGMGHLNRLMSIARRAPDDVLPVFATLSPAFRSVRSAGFPCEYIPRMQGHWRGAEWNPLLTRRLADVIATHAPEVLVFDGTLPFAGLVELRAQVDIPFVWIRRAMWKAGVGERNLADAGIFSLVVEPGELAEDEDHGLTVARRGEALCVDPIVHQDAGELLDRAQARAALDLPVDGTAALVLLGAGRSEEEGSPARAIAERCLGAGVEVVFADWMIASGRAVLPDGVRRIAVHPLSRYFRAFDFAVGAAGYNAFHELVGFGIPAVFLPTEAKLDDQRARSRWAQVAGVGLDLPDFSPEAFERCLQTMLDPAARAEMAERAAGLARGDGAQAAMDAIVGVMDGAASAQAAGA